jgi:GrpB-like predicted nucleotidyltransferase (UPF0157 family)
MPKNLNELTTKELGQLFPIIMSEPNPDWGKIFQAEKEIIIKSLGPDNIYRIEHIGSTAIPNIISKPTIDMLVEIPETTDNEIIINGLTKIGYHYIPRPENPAPYMMFAKGYSEDGFEGQAYHIHVRYIGDWDEIYFRNYLREHPEIASEYADLKVELKERFRNDREAYTEGKTEFVERIVELARKEVGQEAR